MRLRAAAKRAAPVAAAGRAGRQPGCLLPAKEAATTLRLAAAPGVPGLLCRIIPLSRYDGNDRTGRLATSGQAGHPVGQIDEKGQCPPRPDNPDQGGDHRCRQITETAT